VLYAGPGAMLDGATAAWWLGLIDRLEHPITIASPKQCLSLPGISVYGRLPHERIWHRGLPTASIAQALLDLAATTTNPLLVRKGLARRMHIPLPLINTRLPGGVRPDGYWPRERLAVELDGGDNHTSLGQLRTDRANELTLRHHGILLHRYSWPQIHDTPHAIRDDILATLAARG
jgi:hypothetical protein